MQERRQTADEPFVILFTHRPTNRQTEERASHNIWSLLKSHLYLLTYYCVLRAFTNGLCPVYAHIIRILRMYPYYITCISFSTVVLIADVKRTDDPGPPRCFRDFNAPQVKDYCCAYIVYIHTDTIGRHCADRYRDPLEKKKTVSDYNICDINNTLRAVLWLSTEIRLYHYDYYNHHHHLLLNIIYIYTADVLLFFCLTKRKSAQK